MGRRHGSRALALALLVGAVALLSQVCWQPGFLAARPWLRSLLPARGGAVQGRGALALTARGAQDYSSYKAVELKEMCREAKLPVSGTKAVLIARLEERDAASEEVEEEEEENEEEDEEEDEEEEAAPAPAPAKKVSKVPAKKAGAKGKAGAMFQIGEEVEGFYDEDGVWLAAKVVKDLGEGGFTVEWEEDGEAYDLNPGYIRKKISDVDLDGPFLPGEAVKALCDDDNQVYDGIIQRDNGDGTFLLLWDEDGEEYTCKEEVMRKKGPLLKLEELSQDQKLKGHVTKIMEYGAFIDVGAERDGLLHISRMLPPDQNAPPFEEGDRVEALYREDGEEEGWHPATIDSVNEDGTYTITWDEDGDEPYTAKRDEMKLESPRMPVKLNDVVELYVSGIFEGVKLGLSQFECRGQPAYKKKADVTAFQNLGPREWVDGKVISLQPYGAFVEIAAPNGETAQGLVHISKVRDGFVEDIYSELEDGQDVSVRVEEVNVETGKMSLSMK